MRLCRKLITLILSFYLMPVAVAGLIHPYFKNLTDQNQDRAKIAMEKILKSEFPLVEIQAQGQEDKEVILFVQGIDIQDGGHWLFPLGEAIEKGHTVYFHKITQKKSFRNNLKEVISSMQNVYANRAGKKLKVIAYSAGGALSMVAWRKIKRAQMPEAELVTIASPISGYGAPSIAVPFIALFYGGLPAKLSQGLNSELKNAVLTKCSHYINIDCNKDPHSCPKSTTINPQIMLMMPCGWENTKENAQTHHELLSTAVEEILN